MIIDQRERRLWQRIKKHLSNKVFVRRIENGVSFGDPDVFLMKMGRVVWLELKFCPMPAKETSLLVPQGTLRLDQINWALEYANKGGTSGVFIGSDKENFLIPGSIADQINGSTVQELRQKAIIVQLSSLEKVLWP